MPRSNTVKKSVSYTLRMDADLRAKLEALAEKDRRSLANLIEIALWEYVVACDKIQKLRAKTA
jgi:predicted transcriptional regulator